MAPNALIDVLIVESISSKRPKCFDLRYIMACDLFFSIRRLLCAYLFLFGNLEITFFYYHLH